MIALALHCGMPDELTRLRRVFAADVPIFSGVQKYQLPELVSPACKLMVNMGVCGGLAPPLKVADCAVATDVVDRAGLVVDLASPFIAKCMAAAKAAGIVLHPVPWYSSGLLDEADTVAQRQAIFERCRTRPQCINDESRFTVATARSRNIPCVIARPLSDAWDQTLPREARGRIMNADGSPNLEYLARTLRVQDIPTLLGIAADYERSLNALENLARAIEPVLMGA